MTVLEKLVTVMHLQRKYARLLGWIFLCILSGFLAIACNPQSTSNTAKELIVGVSPWPGYSGHYVAMAKDFFKEEGVTVKEIFFPSQGDADTALLAGKLDINWTGLPNAIPQISRDPSVKVIFQCDYSNGSDGIIGRGIKSAADVKGKQVARENILIEELMLRRYLEKMGLTREDVTTIDMTAADAAAAFSARKVDLAVTYEPWMTKAAKQGKGDLIFSSKDSNIIPDGIVAREDLVKERQSELQAYLKAIDKAVKLIRDNAPEVSDIVAKSLNIQPAEVADQLGGVKFYDTPMNKTITFNRSDPMNLFDSLEFASKTAQEMKMIDKAIDVEAALNDTVVKAL